MDRLDIPLSLIAGAEDPPKGIDRRMIQPARDVLEEAEIRELVP